MNPVSSFSFLFSFNLEKRSKKKKEKKKKRKKGNKKVLFFGLDYKDQITHIFWRENKQKNNFYTVTTFVYVCLWEKEKHDFNKKVTIGSEGGYYEIYLGFWVCKFKKLCQRRESVCVCVCLKEKERKFVRGPNFSIKKVKGFFLFLNWMVICCDIFIFILFLFFSFYWVWIFDLSAERWWSYK